MNVLVHLTPAQWDWVLAASLDLGISADAVVTRLLALGQPVLDRQIKLKPRKRTKLRVVRP